MSVWLNGVDVVHFDQEDAPAELVSDTYEFQLSAWDEVPANVRVSLIMSYEMTEGITPEMHLFVEVSHDNENYFRRTYEDAITAAGGVWAEEADYFQARYFRVGLTIEGAPTLDARIQLYCTDGFKLRRVT